MDEKNIRIYHECEGAIDQSVQRITDWHHKACRMMTNGDHEEQIFLSHPHTNNGFFFLLTTILGKNLKKKKNLPENPEYAEMLHGDRHFNITMTSRIHVQPACGCLFFIFP